MVDYIKSIRAFVGNKPLLLPGASVIILNEDKKVLLQLRTDNGLWGLPGGIMELGETVEATAKREVNEETGLNITNISLFGVYSGPAQYYKYPNGDEVYHVDTVFITEHFEGKPVIDSIESRELAFFGIENLPSNICPPDRPILNDLYKILSSSNTRPFQGSLDVPFAFSIL